MTMYGQEPKQRIPGMNENAQKESTDNTREYNFKNRADQEMAMQKCKTLLSEEAAEQLVFVLRTLVDDDFANHCNEAVQEFAKRLFESYGDEPSFFDEAPQWKIFDARARGSLPRAGWSGDFHSVAVLCGSKTSGEEGYIIIDINAQYVHKKIQNGAAFIAHEGNIRDALQKLSDIYGGTWKAEFSFTHGKKEWLG